MAGLLSSPRPSCDKRSPVVVFRGLQQPEDRSNRIDPVARQGQGRDGFDQQEGRSNRIDPVARQPWNAQCSCSAHHPDVAE